ncbi:MAG: GNAT family N-acetyltransferase [Akkermansiaceae bacterium]|jgi:ribosomal protein S18 acetylase RimI-like enzyme|nr:GNAT family N-acetyltransferase [Akkermansiaceae bacterium]
MDAIEPIDVRTLDSSNLADAAHLLGKLNPDTPAHLVRERLATILAEHPHYHLIGAFAGPKLVGVCGAWVATKIWCGRYLEIDNLVVDPECRSGGVGTQLIRHLENIAQEKECTLLVLDSYTNNHPSHRLYHRLGFEIWGFHFIKPIGDWSGKDSA